MKVNDTFNVAEKDIYKNNHQIFSAKLIDSLLFLFFYNIHEYLQ